MHSHMHTSMHMHTRMHAHMHARAHTCAHMHTHTHTHTHTHCKYFQNMPINPFVCPLESIPGHSAKNQGWRATQSWTGILRMTSNRWRWCPSQPSLARPARSPGNSLTSLSTHMLSNSEVGHTSSFRWYPSLASLKSWPMRQVWNCPFF